VMLDGRSVATEYIGGSVTSTGIAEPLNGIAVPVIQTVNGHIRYFEGAEHGWAVARATRDALEVEYRVSDIRIDGAPMRTLARFVQPTGTNAVQQVAGVRGGGAATRTLGRDPADAPARPGSALDRRRRRDTRAETRDLERRVRVAERRATRRRSAARRARLHDQRNATRKNP
ncbi:MAG: hypothetical protein AB7G37_11600, partial [Solirubrobacteraceae bacterium]